MKILYTGRQFYPCMGGTEIFMMECAKRLVKLGHQVTVIALNRDLYKGTHLSAYEEHQGIKIHRVPFLPGGLKPIPLFNPLWMARLTAEHDVVHSHDIRFLLETQALARVLLRKPLVIGTYGFIFHQKKNMAIKKLVFEGYMKPVFRLADRLHAISLQDQAKIEGAFAPEKIQLITGGVDCGKYASVQPKPQPGKLVCFGRLDIHKGVDLMFQALAQVKTPFTLHLIYGSSVPAYFDKLKKLESELGLESKIRWHGYQTDDQMREHLGQAQYVVLPSLYEGFGLTTLEAMAAGAVPIANRIDAFENVMTHERDGFLVDFQNAGESARLIDQYLALPPDKLSSLSQAARARAREFDWDRRVDQLVEMYRSLVQTQNQRSPAHASSL